MTKAPIPTEPPASSWHALDPLTRLFIAVGTVVAAMLFGGIVCLALLGLAAVLLPAVVARVLRQVLGLGLTLSLPLAFSVVVVNVLFSIDGETIAEIGPLAVTREGVQLAVSTLARVLTMAGAVVLFYATTRPSELVASLVHHRLSPRAAFVIHNGVAMIPRLAERAGEVAEAQRARGLDSERRWWRRGRGMVALAGPTVLGAIDEAETRSLALETRGFTRPGRPTQLWPPNDSTSQRAARGAVALAVGLLLLARIVGVPLPC